MNRADDTASSCPADLSLNWVIRRSSPNWVTELSSQQSSVCSRTSDWTKRTLRVGSIPEASSTLARLRMFCCIVSLLGDPVADCAEIVAKVEAARGLDPGKDPLPLLCMGGVRRANVFRHFGDHSVAAILSCTHRRGPDNLSKYTGGGCDVGLVDCVGGVGGLT